MTTIEVSSSAAPISGSASNVPSSTSDASASNGIATSSSNDSKTDSKAAAIVEPVPVRQFSVQVKTLSGGVWTIDMAPAETIRILKTKLERQPKAPPMEAMLKFVALGKQLDDDKAVDEIYKQTMQIPATNDKAAATITVLPTDSLVELNAKLTAAGGTALTALTARPPMFMVVSPDLVAKHENDRTNRLALAAAEESKAAAKKAADAAEAAKLAELTRRSDPKFLATEIAAASTKIAAAKDADDLVSILCAEAKRLRFPAVPTTTAVTSSKSSVAPAAWTCQACAKNQPFQHNFCADCGHPAPPRLPQMSYAVAAGGNGGSAAAAAVPVKWNCPKCTYENDGNGRSAFRCDVCEANNPAVPPAAHRIGGPGRFRVARGMFGGGNGNGNGGNNGDIPIPAAFVQRMAQIVGQIGHNNGGNNNIGYDDDDGDQPANDDGNRSGADDDHH